VARLTGFSALLALLIVVFAPQGRQPALAHALDPGYLELRAVNERTWSVFWRSPDIQGRPMPITPRIEGACRFEQQPALAFDGRGWSARWPMHCEMGLQGLRITIEGLEKTRTDVLVRFENAPGESGNAWRLLPSAPSFLIPEDPGALQVLTSYFGLGVEHILLGLDHLLFVLALLLLIRNVPLLIGAITAFTVAHSLTLGLAAVGWLNVPGPPVEAVIALSIVFLAVEIVKDGEGGHRLSARAPWLISFGFGLIHGLGFGSALKEIGLPQNEILLALFSFNLGVEAGQIAFVFAALGVGWVLRLLFSRRSMRGARLAASYLIGSVAAFWLVERIAAF
jgi:hydrogenase/urease accessory protein HupE